MQAPPDDARQRTSETPEISETPEEPGRRSTGRDFLGALSWERPEVAWPLALLAGFGGTWIGIAGGVSIAVVGGASGLAAVVAATLFAPLWWQLHARGRPGLAAFAACAWALGIVAAVVGAMAEWGVEAVEGGLPYAATHALLELEPLLAGDVDAGAELLPNVLRNLLLLLLVAALARPLRGLLALVPLAAGAGVIGSGAGRVALRIEADDLSLAAASAIAPHLALGLAGALLVSAALADPHPLRPWDGRSWRSRTLAAGVLLAVVGLLLEPWIAVGWGGWLGGRLE